MFRVSFDKHFDFVIEQCRKIKRKGQDGTWINNEMLDAYKDLHACHLAHSVEVYCEDKIVGGLYGVSLGAAFFGESMFSLMTDASKIAFYHLVRFAKQSNFYYIDCQVKNSHLESLGAALVSRHVFFEYLEKSNQEKTLDFPWWKKYQADS